MSPEMTQALAVVKATMQPDCWRAWKGPEYGNTGSMTIRWAYDNVDKWLKDHNPEAVVIMFGTNDLGQLDLKEYDQKTRDVVERCLKNGTVVILTTIPPRSGALEKAKQFADAVRCIARDEQVPLIDYQAEILKRRPDDWDGALPRFKDAPGDEYQVPTLIARDGVHPSNPRAYQDYSAEGLRNNGYALRSYLTLLTYADAIRAIVPPDKLAAAVLPKAATLYASFDDGVRADFGGGDLTPGTRFNDEADKGKFVFEKGFDAKVFRITPDKGVHGGALECAEALPRNGRFYFPAKGNLAYRKGGWGGTLSVWLNLDPGALKTRFCDPVQITQKGANNGGIWIDFNDARPRALRHGAFPAVTKGQDPVKEDDPAAPLVRVADPGFKAGEWHHVAVTWQNFDTGRKDGRSALYVDGKLVGEIRDRSLATDWDLDETGIYIGVNYLGLLDELALFNRPLTAEEVRQLHSNPGLLAGLKKPAGKEK
jgi:hypothetical protein